MKLFGLNITKVLSTIADSGTGIVKAWADLSSDWYKPNWWQLGQDKPDSSIALTSSAVYTCVSILAQEIARLQIIHFTNPDLKGQVEMYKSKLALLLRKPNSYQTRSDFFLSLMYSLLMEGKFFGLAVRNRSGTVVSITPLNPRMVVPFVLPGTNEVYYSISALDIDPIENFDPSLFIPARNMLHIRLFTPTHPLIGVTPLVACNISMAHGLSIQSEATRFFDNQAKPAGILRTPKPLTDKQASRLRNAWSTGTNGINTGKIPVLDNDLQFQQMSLSAADAQMIEQYAMTKKDIAMVYRIPMYMVGEGDSQFKTAEAAQRDFITRTLGFYIEHIEASLENFFDFDGRTKAIEFDVEGGIMRPEYVQRIEGLVKGVQGGIFTPDEARHSENMPAIAGGMYAYMQRQMVRLEHLGLDVLAMGADDAANDSDTDDDDTLDTDDEDKSINWEYVLDNLEEQFG